MLVFGPVPRYCRHRVQMSTGARTAILAGAAATLAALAGPAAAAAAEQGTPTGPYDGHMPFACALQDVGTGTAFPDPAADPFCVEFDKTEQNVTDLGLLDFTSKEPERVAAAGPKCFYFQRDHWTGSIVQGTEPETYHYDGSYWYDQATGDGGVHIDNFRIGGQTSDSSQYVPDEYKPYFGMGGGGAMTHNDSQVRPDCLTAIDSAQKRKRVYAHELPGTSIFRKQIPPFVFGMTRKAVVDAEGLPYLKSEGTDRYRVEGGGQRRIAFAETGDSASVEAVLTTAPKDVRSGVHPGDAMPAARRGLHAKHPFTLGTFKVFEAPRRKRSRMFIAAAGGKAAWIAITDPARLHGRKATRRTLRSLAFGQTTRVDSAGIPY